MARFRVRWNPAAQGIGFAVPSDTARWVVSQLLTVGRVRRGTLGIAVRARDLGRRLVLRYEDKMVLNVVPGEALDA